MRDEERKVALSKLVEKMSLEAITPELDISDIYIYEKDVNRPALQLLGFYDYFDAERIQLIGHVETAYMQEKMSRGKSLEMMERLMKQKVPCIVYCWEIPVDEEIRQLAIKLEIPLFRTQKTTSSFMAEAVRWLHVELAPSISIHGVLVDVDGEGVLITGESGIGKSEAALELIKRGHRLVSDDVVDIRKVSDDTLIGSAPDVTKHLIELRGIGVIDVKTLFGVESVKDTQSIDLVIQLLEWNKNEIYDRMGLEDHYIEYLGNKVVCHSIPIRPGRNLAVICEAAAVNYRQKKMGYNAARELYARVTQNIERKS